MRTNKCKFIEYTISTISLVVILFCYIIPTYALTEKEIKNEQSEIDKKIQETSSEIAGVKSKMTKALSQINTYNSQISGFENEISVLDEQIAELECQISEKEAIIQEQEIKYQEKQELLDKRLVALYETGNTSYIDMLLSAESLSDFISKCYLIEQLAEYDTELLNGIQAIKDGIQSEKDELENAKVTIVTSKNEIEVKKNSVAGLRNEKNSLVKTLSSEEKTLQEELDQFEKDKKELQAKLQKIIAQEGGSYSGTPSTKGYICPLAGKSKANITTGYLGYSGHTGVDFACSSGTPILAAKSGTVVISTALKNSNGKYRSYGEYIVINHGDGAMTLYAHMSKRAVGENAHVSQGQVIGYVGSTGNSTGPHLHFEVRVNGKTVNPTPYLP